jgi:hypothetical protein
MKGRHPLFQVSSGYVWYIRKCSFLVCFLFPTADLTEYPQILGSLLCALTNMYGRHGCSVMWKYWRRFSGCDSNPHSRHSCLITRVNFNFLIWVLLLVEDSVIWWHCRGKRLYLGWRVGTPGSALQQCPAWGLNIRHIQNLKSHLYFLMNIFPTVSASMNRH